MCQPLGLVSVHNQKLAKFNQVQLEFMISTYIANYMFKHINYLLNSVVCNTRQHGHGVGGWDAVLCRNFLFAAIFQTLGPLNLGEMELVCEAAGHSPPCGGGGLESMELYLPVPNMLSWYSA
jgi:hypothetical protein